MTIPKNDHIVFRNGTVTILGKVYNTPGYSHKATMLKTNGHYEIFINHTKFLIDKKIFVFSWRAIWLNYLWTF